MTDSKDNHNYTEKYDEDEYIGCGCGDLEHVSKIRFDSEFSHFYLEYHLHKFPGTNRFSIENLGTFDRLTFDIRVKFKLIKNYLWNLKNAVIGRPQYFCGQAEWDPNEAYKIVKFINRKLGI